MGVEDLLVLLIPFASMERENGVVVVLGLNGEKFGDEQKEIAYLVLGGMQFSVFFLLHENEVRPWGENIEDKAD